MFGGLSAIDPPARWGNTDLTVCWLMTDGRKSLTTTHWQCHPDLRSNRLEVRNLEHVGHAIVESQHGGLQLSDDAILVVARVADQGSAVGTARKVGGARIIGIAG
jgi:hypothetical protein